MAGTGCDAKFVVYYYYSSSIWTPTSINLLYTSLSSASKKCGVSALYYWLADEDTIN